MTPDEFDNVLIEWAANVRAPLALEAEKYTQAMTFNHTNRLRALGVQPFEAIADCVIGVAKVETMIGDMWQPIESGREFLTVAVREGSATTDIVAFDPRDATRWFLRKRGAWALGFDAIEQARGSFVKSETMLDLHMTPLDWLRADRTGVCVIDWTHEARATLLDCPHIRVFSKRAELALKSVLYRPARVPQIIVKGERQRAA